MKFVQIKDQTYVQHSSKTQRRSDDSKLFDAKILLLKVSKYNEKTTNPTKN